MACSDKRRGRAVGRSRWHLSVTGAILAIGAGLLAAPSVGSGAPPVSRCHSSQLKVKLVSFQGATGHRFWQLAFDNLGSRCRFHGFPRIVLLNAGGHPIPATVGHETGPVPQLVVAHGQRGHFTFSYLDGGFCSHRFFASRLRISPPGSTLGLGFNPVPANHGPISVCVGSERVSPVRGHPDG